MQVNNLNVVFVKSNLTNRAVVVKCTGTEEFYTVVNLIDSGESLMCFVKDSLDSMEKEAEDSTYKYLFLCESTNRYGLLYSDCPITHLELLQNNE